MIKTLHLTNAYHSQSGGIRTFYQAMLAAATDEQRFLRLVVPADRTSIEEVSRSARIYHVRAPRSPFIDRRYRLLLPHRFLFGTRGPIWQILRAENPDLIEVCDKYALCYLGGLVRRGWLTRAPRPALVGLTCERMDDNIRAFLSGSSISARLAAWYMRTVYVPQFDSHIAVSGYTADEVEIGVRPVHITPSEADVDHGVPLFLDQLVVELRDGPSKTQDIKEGASQHGHDMLLQGFTVSQVVHDYGDVCQSVTDLAVELAAPISTDDFRTLNRCLDDAIAGAVTEHAREQEVTRDGQSSELRSLLNTAITAFEVLQTGSVGVAGRTGGMVHRSLIGARDLIDRQHEEIAEAESQ